MKNTAEEWDFEVGSDGDVALFRKERPGLHGLRYGPGNQILRLGLVLSTNGSKYRLTREMGFYVWVVEKRVLCFLLQVSWNEVSTKLQVFSCDFADIQVSKFEICNLVKEVRLRSTRLVFLTKANSSEE